MNTRSTNIPSTLFLSLPRKLLLVLLRRRGDGARKQLLNVVIVVLMRREVWVVHLNLVEIIFVHVQLPHLFSLLSL